MIKVVGNDRRPRHDIDQGAEKLHFNHYSIVISAAGLVV